jgi:hypothetical protein
MNYTHSNSMVQDLNLPRQEIPILWVPNVYIRLYKRQYWTRSGSIRHRPKFQTPFTEYLTLSSKV